jgi:hypothetical protein
MKTRPVVQPAVDEEQSPLRTLWFADGRSFPARVTKVQKDGIHITSPETSGFIEASDLSTVDRVHYGFGTRKEDAWVARMNANQAKKKLTLELHK